MTTSKQYFDWIRWRFAWASSWHWHRITLEDASWKRVALGLYWRAAKHEWRMAHANPAAMKEGG